MLSKVSVETLLTIAGCTGVFVGLSIYWMQKSMNRHQMSSPYYTAAVKVVEQHTVAKKLLGEPLAFGSLEFSKEHYHITANKCSVAIPVIGSKEFGTLYVKAAREQLTDRFRTPTSTPIYNSVAHFSSVMSNPAGAQSIQSSIGNAAVGSGSTGQHSKYSQLLAVIDELGKDIRPTYTGNRMSAERLKRSITTARLLVRECLIETEKSARS